MLCAPFGQCKTKRNSKTARRGRRSRRLQATDFQLRLEALEARALLSVSATSTTLSASALSLGYGQSETLTATVAPIAPGTGTPTGSVDFYDQSTHTDLGSQNLSGGAASVIAPALSVGSHVITAIYTSDSGDFLGSSTIVGPNSIIATVAGNGTMGYSGDGGPATNAQLLLPRSVAVDSAGDLFIADGNNNVVREVRPDGTITTVAGNGTQGYSGDGGPAASAELNEPQGVAVDSAGDLFIADAFNRVVREVRPDGTITTVAGNGTNGYSGDGGPATSAELSEPLAVTVDSSGDLFIADTFNNVVREVHPDGTISTVAGNGTKGYSGDGGSAMTAEFTYPTGVAVDSSGNLFIADEGNQRIREVHLDGTITTVAGNGIAGYSGDGGPATNAEVRNPYSVLVDSSGDLFVADYGNNVIREVRPDGTITTVAGNGTAGYSGDGGPATSAELLSRARKCLTLQGDKEVE